MANEIEIDLEKLKRDVKEIAASSTKTGAYYPYRHLICALKNGGLRYKYILEYLYSEYEDLAKINAAARINNKRLQDFVYQWRKKGLIDFDAVKELRLSIFDDVKKDVQAGKGDSLTMFGTSYNLLTFAKEVQKNGVKIDASSVDVKAFFDAYKDGEGLDGLVKLFITSKKVIEKLESQGVIVEFEREGIVSYCNEYKGKSIDEIVESYLNDKTNLMRG